MSRHMSRHIIRPVQPLAKSPFTPKLGHPLSDQHPYQNPGNRVPGPSEGFPTDGPPTVEFSKFPRVYGIPIFYVNPVSGRE